MPLRRNPPGSDPWPIMTLDPPYVLDADKVDFRFIGWTEVNDEEAPDIALTVNGVPVPINVFPRPEVRKNFPGLQVRALSAQVNFKDVLADTDPMQDGGGFMLRAAVRSDHRLRTFEYAVTPAWLREVFGHDGLKAFPVPPEPLQIRVTGAAVGYFSAGGREVARQIEEILEAYGVPFPERGRVHDFGSGPGRVLAQMAVRHPHTLFSASDIDAEAMAWCAEHMSHFGEFFVNQPQPPLPFADGELDLVYSISIFTHLPEDMQHAWLAELARVVKPGGFVLTTKTNPYVYDLPDWMTNAAREKGFVYAPDMGQVDGLPDFYRLAYHTEDYVRRVWGEYFEVLHVGSHDLNTTQDAVLLRKPTSAPVAQSAFSSTTKRRSGLFGWPKRSSS
ncbi:class I SAM-dependent methyltransferase [Phenylobacterium soli]|nr:class I SAM-dependent methyltransferase [Phenylobacterium soli]